MSFIQQLIQLLTEAPGSILYHMITLLSIQAALGLALWQWRHRSNKDTADDSLSKRMVWAMSGILLARLAILLAILLTSDPEMAARILPPLEQAIDTVTVAIIVWVFSPRLPAVPRLGDMVLLIVLLVTGIMYAYFAQTWINQIDNSQVSLSYITSNQAFIWHIFQLSLLIIGVILVVIGRQRHWFLRLAVLFTLLLAHSGQLLTNWSTFIPTDSDIAYWVRLGNLFAFPLLVVVVYRHNLSQLLFNRAGYRTSGDQLSRHLQLSRNVIDSLDINTVLHKALRMAADLVRAEYTALAVVSMNNRNQLHLLSTRLPEIPGASPPRINQQNWALNLEDWPAIRLAMQQRQLVELVPTGLGARQLYDIHQELGIGDLGALLIEPLLVSEDELGVLLLAGPAERERWPEEDKSLSFTVAAYLAQAIQNARQYQKALQEQGNMTGADETVVSGRLITLEEELRQARTEIESVKARWKHSESQLAAESQRSREFEEALEAAETFNRNERVETLEEEVETLRESLMEAEEAMALASAGEAGLSPEWVTMAITRYSGEVEEAMARIQQLESRLAQQEDSQTRVKIASLAQELRTPLTSLGGYSDLLLGESMGILGTKQMNLMRRVKANIDLMSNLLEQLIQLSRNQPSPSANETQVNVRETIESAIHSVRSTVRDKSLRIDLDLADNIPPVPSDGDAFYQIVVHLLNHACLVSRDDGRILISAHYDSIQETSLEGAIELFDFLHLAISDSGDGLSQEIHSLVLEAQRQPDRIAAVQLNNIGQNMSTAVSLINAQRGRVWLSQEWETGDTISVLLPLASNVYAYPNGKPVNED